MKWTVAITWATHGINNLNKFGARMDNTTTCLVPINEKQTAEDEFKCALDGRYDIIVFHVDITIIMSKQHSARIYIQSQGVGAQCIGSFYVRSLPYNCCLKQKPVFVRAPSQTSLLNFSQHIS